MQAVQRFKPKGLPVRDLRRVVDQGSNSGIHPALVVAGAHGHYGGLALRRLKNSFFRFVRFRSSTRANVARPDRDNWQAARRHETRRDRHETVVWRRRLAQRRDSDEWQDWPG